MEKEDNGRDRFAMKETDPHSPSPLPEPHDVREAFMGILASLVAAVYLLKHGGKKAAASDKMFDQMILDYERAIEQGRAALAQSDAQVRVTDAMVKAARQELERWGLGGKEPAIRVLRQYDDNDGSKNTIKATCTSFDEAYEVQHNLAMRQALLAALAQSDAQPIAHGEAIRDCPTEGVAARQGNGG